MESLLTHKPSNYHNTPWERNIIAVGFKGAINPRPSVQNITGRALEPEAPMVFRKFLKIITSVRARL